MLARNPHITMPMRQSPDVRGVTIDFGGAPDHGRWRATKLRITFSSGRRIGWARSFGDFHENRRAPLHIPSWRALGERIVHIELIKWEMTE